MGDRKPSEFYRFMKTLADNANLVNDGLLTNLWMRQLPVLVQTAVKASGKAEVNGMLEVADSVYEVYQQQSFKAVNDSVIPSSSNISELVAQNERLVSELASIKDRFDRMQNPRGRSRDRSRARSRDNRSGSNSNNRPLCWYHFKYGANARKCHSPCNFRNRNNSGSNANTSSHSGSNNISSNQSN